MKFSNYGENKEEKTQPIYQTFLKVQQIQFLVIFYINQSLNVITFFLLQLSCDIRLAR